MKFLFTLFVVLTIISHYSCWIKTPSLNQEAAPTLHAGDFGSIEPYPALHGGEFIGPEVPDSPVKEKYF